MNQQVFFGSDQYLVSETDGTGVITYANDAFVSISGYSREELLGKPHNIVRHPDMPAEAFGSLWGTVKMGLPWRGMVKNRTKTGDYYWVWATVTPLIRDGQIVGYRSVRAAPSQAQINDAELLYSKVRNRNAKLPAIKKQTSLKARMWAGVGAFAVALVAGAFVFLGQVQSSSDALEAARLEDLKPTQAMAQVLALMADNRANVLLALQHQPGSPFVAMHDHGIEVHLEATKHNRKKIDELMAGLTLPEDSPVKRYVEAFNKARLAYADEGLSKAREALAEGDFHKGNLIILTKLNPLYAEASKAGVELREALEKNALEREARLDAKMETLRWLVEAGAAALLVLLAVGGWLLLRAVHRPIAQGLRHMERIAAGDLTDEIDISGRSETGQLLCHLASMQVSLRAMLDEVRSSAHSVEQQGNVVLGQVETVAHSTQEQNALVQAVASATEEFSQSVAEVAGNAMEAAETARDSGVLVRSNGEQLSASIASTSQVVDSVTTSAQSIGELSDAIKLIGEITGAIRDIAEQTNLLALNAAIEAARAGDQGRGFAVVADEVRKLSERTGSATRDISQKIVGIERLTGVVVAQMQEVSRVVTSGVSDLTTAGSGLAEIQAAYQATESQVAHISAATEQQQLASQDVARNMEQVAELLDRNAHATRSAHEAAEQLKQTAGRLERMVGKFKLH